MTLSSLAGVLNKRSKWELIVIDYKLPSDRLHGTINNLQWFIKNGHRSNSLRDGFKEAQNLAKEIVNDVNY
jgi:hypothetical protein